MKWLRNISWRKIRNSFQIINSDVTGINERNATLVYRYNDRKYFHLADDKILTKEILEQNNLACAKSYAKINGMGEIATKWEIIESSDIKTLAIKPARGRGGGGIKILRRNDVGEWFSGKNRISKESIFLHMGNIIMGAFSLGTKDRVLIEYTIEPHPFFSEIYPDGVPDFRVILLKDKPLMAMLRIPTDKSDGKANLHQGGLGIGVDMLNGTLEQGFDGNRYYNVHPDSKGIILDKKIPQWDEILQLSIATSKHFPLDYLGIDIVLDEHLGPLVLEINVRPGLGIQLVNKKGIKQILNERKPVLKKVQGRPFKRNNKAASLI